MPVMAIMLLIGRSRALRGRFVVPRSVEVGGWIATGLMGFSALAMLLKMA